MQLEERPHPGRVVIEVECEAHVIVREAGEALQEVLGVAHSERPVARRSAFPQDSRPTEGHRRHP